MTFTHFIKRPVLSTVVSIFFVLLGTIGLISLPIEQYPDVAPPTISVRTTYTGADAQTVLNSVITPLEESINGVENMTYMTSQATNDGSASITVYFKQGAAADILGEFVFGDEVFLISFNSVLNHIFYPKLPYKYRLFRIIGKRFFHV